MNVNRHNRTLMQVMAGCTLISVLSFISGMIVMNFGGFGFGASCVFAVIIVATFARMLNVVEDALSEVEAELDPRYRTR